MQLKPRTERFGVGNQTWLGSAHGTEHPATGTIKGDAFTDFGKFIPSGVPVKLNDEGLLEPVTAAGDTLLGFIFTDQALAEDGSNQPVPYIWHGRIRAENLPEKAFDVTTLTTPNPQFTIVAPATNA